MPVVPYQPSRSIAQIGGPSITTTLLNIERNARCGNQSVSSRSHSGEQRHIFRDGKTLRPALFQESRPESCRSNVRHPAKMQMVGPQHIATRVGLSQKDGGRWRQSAPKIDDFPRRQVLVTFATIVVRHRNEALQLN